MPRTRGWCCHDSFIFIPIVAEARVQLQTIRRPNSTWLGQQRQVADELRSMNIYSLKRGTMLNCRLILTIMHYCTLFDL